MTSSCQQARSAQRRARSSTLQRRVLRETISPTAVIKSNSFTRRVVSLCRAPWLPALRPGAVDAIVKAVSRKMSPHSGVVWHHFHGAATRIPAEATAFGFRQEHFMVEIIASEWLVKDAVIAKVWPYGFSPESAYAGRSLRRTGA